MKTFVIFDRKTGEILQMHMELGEHCHDARDLLKTARPDARADAVDVLAVDGLQPEATYRVDVKERKLVALGKSKAHGAGWATVQSTTGDPCTARTVVFEVEREKE